jgi:hypothetical protein
MRTSTRFFVPENGGTRSQELILHSAGSDVIEITPEGEIKKELTTEGTEEHRGKSTAGYISISQATTGLALTVGSFACCQASNPPVTLITCLKPARCSRLLAIMLRYPPLQ